ncbi:MAG TPA: PH domain-containing protein [Candidatus Limnocylindria bacterium]|nr:PH domain-containing protein [Candidatus Limnocylindria bacterium]
MGYDRELIPAGERPDPVGWVAVSPKLATARRLVALAVVGVLTLIGVVVAAVTLPPWMALLVMVVGLGLAGWAWWLIGRQVAATAYSERTDDLVVRSGIVFRRTVIVPYGRMQLVDVTTGPVDRWCGIAAVQLHTAAATTDASIPGLPTDEAARLRDHLAALGEARSAGL